LSGKQPGPFERIKGIVARFAWDEDLG
jgi:hypothetical protein